jgi:hypothetical protein
MVGNFRLIVHVDDSIFWVEMDSLILLKSSHGEGRKSWIIHRTELLERQAFNLAKEGTRQEGT